MTLGLQEMMFILDTVRGSHAKTVDRVGTPLRSRFLDILRISSRHA